MRFALASALLLVASTTAVSASADVLNLIKRLYYAYGYEGNTTTGVPNGCV